jgi:citrate synthase
MNQAQYTAQLKFSGSDQTIEFPIYKGTLGPDVIDIRIFVMARTVGWIAQWNEMIADPEQKIGRPRQLFVGEPVRTAKPLATR